MKNSCSGIKEDWCCKGKSPWKQHALKGQKLLAQGIALGILAIDKAPCKVGCSKSINFPTRFLHQNTS